MASQLDSFSNLGNWNFPLRIQRRGNFFSDDGFQDYRRHFESAAKDLLHEFDITRNEDTFKTYRRFRDHQLTGTDKATKIAEEADKYKIVMDVEGFSEGDLQVKISGPSEIVVEGRQEFSNGGNSFSQRSFRRRFSLPGLALVEDASSVLSSDNILTVNIPKRVQEITNQSQQSSLTSLKQQQQQASQFNKIESEIQENKQKDQESLSSFKSDIADASSLSSLGKGTNIFNLEIVPKNSFFDDSFFENVRHNFKKSIEDMVETRRRRLDSIKEDAGIFRKVRETKMENAQAVSVTEDAKEHKIVLDVSGFSEADLKLRAVTEYELVVEGKVEKKTANTNCSHSFKKRFVLPSSVDIHKATSALSSEGILTILVPKRQLESIDYAIPIQTAGMTSNVAKEAANRISNVIKKEQAMEENQLKTHIAPQHPGESLTSTTTKTSTKVVESQSLLDNFAKGVEKEKKVCSGTMEQKGHIVPINLEGEQEHSVKISTEKKSDISQDVREKSSVLKESQRLMSESTKLLEDLEKPKQSPKEYYVPVEVDTGTGVSSSSQQTTCEKQHMRNTKDMSSHTLQSSLKDHQQKLTDSPKSHPSSRIIPISLKGSVYNETIFDDARKSIEKNVQDVFSKYLQTSEIERQEKNASQMTAKQDSTSVVKNGQTVQEDDHTYKIVIDVYGFEEKELNVKVSGTTEICVEGSSQKAKNGSISKHSFRRTFQLPGCADFERTSTALSEEGLLTIKIPKKNQIILKNEKVTPILSKEINKPQLTGTMVIDSSGIVQETRTQKDISIGFSDDTSQSSPRISVPPTPAPTEGQFPYSSDHSGEFIVPVSIEQASDVTSEVGSVYSTSNLSSQMSTVSDTSKDVSKDILSDSTSVSSIDTQIHSNSHRPEETGARTINIKGIDDIGTTAIGTKTMASNLCDDIMSRSSVLFNLPIVSKGYFFDDSFFQESRSMFESILRDKMNRFSRSSSFVDDINFFKSLREKKITGGSQMATLSEDDSLNKIVLDVQGFNEDNLKVKALSDNEILIEGEIEEKTNSSISKKSFRKHFVLPGAVDLKRATSALSSDGVLNIKIPKKC